MPKCCLMPSIKKTTVIEPTSPVQYIAEGGGELCTVPMYSNKLFKNKK
jgi:hypothetical protein